MVERLEQRQVSVTVERRSHKCRQSNKLTRKMGLGEIRLPKLKRPK